jgi:ribosome-binding factor A
MARLESKEKAIYQVVSIVISSEIKDKAITGVTVTGCSLTKDLSFAKIYYTVMGKDEKKQKVESALARAKGFIKKRIADEVPLRKIPELLFEYDHSLESGNRIESLLRSIKD